MYHANLPPEPDHPFLEAPNRTLIRLTVPVLFSLIAEPLTGLVDTAFIARLGAAPLAALGVGTMALSSVFWVFNFLGIATQTDVARADGRDDHGERAHVAGLALTVAAVLGTVAALTLWPVTPWITGLLGATDDIQTAADAYTTIRWIGAPAIIVTLAGFGALRGIQRMRLPLHVAVGINLINIALDPILIFGLGPVPALGIAGAAIASVIAQWIGAVAVLILVRKHVGARMVRDAERIKRLFRTGTDIFLRTMALTAFLFITTREATRLGAEAGAVHQAIRQFWIFTALFLDSVAIAGQSLVAWFMGQDSIRVARRVSASMLRWVFGLGCFLSLAMWLGSDWIAVLLVPESARPAFTGPWLIALLFMPLNALAFGTDGIHWGTADFRFLRDATVAATLVGVAVIYIVQFSGMLDITTIWLVTAVWILIRVAFGVGRIWPGSSNAPLGRL